ncbi:DUF4114 domain-containing protein [Pontibacterium sp. N1Y112]|uniref:DUF4114 domain-containing protein n=1 Tax=Pontibacterium sinense TaxID=2781979 RepID=A0A8J7FAJ9_9GAMM|nr:DUF4114 domain-containing protein [Pontibacterium sinense]MBE9396126.1 DUF4114 domain-containing protein [Pontibacterium sinense]
MNTLHLKRSALAALLSSGFVTSAHAADDATDTLVNIDLPTGLVQEVQNALPESANVNQEYLNTDYNPNITFQSDAHVGITFLDEGAGYRNSLGYFTFADDTFDSLSFGDIDTNNDGHVAIKELTSVSGITAGMIFNNVSETGGGGSLNAGDTVVLGGANITNVNGTDFDMTGGTTFSDGTNMGFFVLQNAWSGKKVNSWDNNKNTLAMYTVDFLNPENSASATSDNTDINARHVAMMNSLSADNDIIIGFEDLVRPYGDNDFNDAVFRIRTDPVDAMYAFVPTTQTVINMQAAPAPAMGKSMSGMALMAFGMMVMYRRRKPGKKA